jgi:hypothetical protein
LGIICRRGAELGKTAKRFKQLLRSDHAALGNDLDNETPSTTSPAVAVAESFEKQAETVDR